MPELPEVETVRRGLEPSLTGATVKSVLVRRRDLRWPIPDDFEDRFTGRQITAVRRRSKYVLLDTDDAQTAILHLGMSGRIKIAGDPLGQFHHAVGEVEKHDHVVVTTDAGAEIVFNDARRFGSLDLVDTEKLAEHWLIRSLGPEPLGNAFNADHLAKAFKSKTSPIKNALLDQRVVAGLGNIYVCEALFRSGISPTRQAGRVSKLRLETLVGVIREVLLEAIEAGGSSLRDHRQTDGELGYFQHNFTVYDREGETCVTDGCGGTIRRIVQSGRSTFHCPQCQR